MGRNIGFAVWLTMMMIFRARAAIYTVGDDAGWRTGVDYEKWAEDKTFIVGDSLLFNYDYDSVNQVNKETYDLCTFSTPIYSDNSGSSIFVLTTSGTKYFMSMDTNSCEQGMKLKVNVCNVGVGVGGVASLCVGV